MLNTNNSTAQSFKFSNLFIASKAKEVVKPSDSTTGRIFKFENFAKDWDSVYIRPEQLGEGAITVGMRCVTEPTLVTTTEGHCMAFIMASKDTPVFIPYSFAKEDEGYVLAYRISPLVTVEYIFYLCKFGQWEWTIKNSADYDFVRIIGQVDAGIDPDGNLYEIVFTPEMAYGRGEVEIPSLKIQDQMVEAAKRQESDFQEHSVPEFDTKELISKYMNASQIANPFTNSGIGLLVECYKLWLKDFPEDIDPKVLEILRDYKFNEGILNEFELGHLKSQIRTVFDLVVKPYEFVHKGGEGFMQPKEVTDFILKIADFPKDVTVYNPFAGAASYVVGLPNKVVGEEINPITWALAQIRMSEELFDTSEITLGDSFVSLADGKKYKAILSSPAYLYEKEHSIFEIIRHLYDKLEDGGKMVCLVPAGFLFSGSPKERAIRERLIADRAISAVVKLPNNIFGYTNINQDVIIVTKAKPNESILFADASGYTRFAKSVYKATTFDYSQFISDLEDEVDDYYDRGCVIYNSTIGAPILYTEIIGSDLSPERYLIPKPDNSIQLSSLASVVTGERDHDKSAEYYISSSSLPEMMHRKPFVPGRIKGKESDAKEQVILEGDYVIIALRKGEIRTVYLENFRGVVAIPSKSIIILKPADGVSAKYLAALLSTEMAKKQIVVANHDIIPQFGKFNISEIMVANLETPKEREKLIAEVLSSEMGELERELEEDHKAYVREVRSTRHAMIQTLSALSSNWEQLKLFSELNGGYIKMADVVGRINPITVENLMKSIGHAVRTLQNQVESLRYERADWGAEEDIDPVEFISSYIETHSSPDIKMELVERNNSADFSYFDEKTGDYQTVHSDAVSVFKAPRRLVERIFNNIVSNAKSHGFSSRDKENIIRFQWEEEGYNLVIKIANNGAPLKEGVTGEDVLMNGFSTSLNEQNDQGALHSGHGGFEIKSLMEEKVGNERLGTVEIFSLPDDEFPVIYKLTFENTNTVKIL